MKLNIKLTNEDFYVFQVLNENLMNPVVYDKFEVKFLRLVDFFHKSFFTQLQVINSSN